MDIAYQVFGEGPLDLLVLAGPSIPIDAFDSEPSLSRFYRRLASFSRVIRFDFRGMGLSSRVPSLQMIGPKFWVEDAIAVMDAVGCQQAAILATSYNAMSGLVLAAEHRERVASLVIINGTARVLWAPDYPAGAKAKATDPFTSIAMETDAVEQGFDVLGVIAPTVARDDAFRTWWDHAGNRAASPSMARAVSKVVTASDVRDTLVRIAVPTLILQRDRVKFIPPANGRFLAEHIAGARYVELPGPDSLYWVGDAGPLLEEIEEFITGVRGGSEAERVLTTIVFTDIVGSTERAAALGDGPLARPARRPRRHRAPRARPFRRARSQHRRRRIRGDVHQSQRRDRVCRRVVDAVRRYSRG
jgi:pimeloyl-ACP methyl ester carboxylesterase